MSARRTLHIKCATWDQVEAFYQRKLRRGNVLSMKVPFVPDVGSALTLGLELPSQLVIAIDGKVVKASAVEGTDKTWISIELVGLTRELLARLRSLVAEGRSSAATRPRGEPSADELPADERQLFMRMSADLRMLRQLPVHEVLGVDSDADPGAVRRGWLELVGRYHPDVVAPHRSPAISHLAEELLILANRAYHRMRESLIAEGRATALGAGMVQTRGWLIGFDEIGTGDKTPPPMESPLRQPAYSEGSGPERRAATEPATGQAGEGYEQQARALLASGDNPAAKEMLATALCAYPRSRPLRSLYYVASALTALDAGQVMLARSQLEAALAHDEQCVEAAAILDQLRRDGAQDYGSVRRLFQ